MMKQIESKQESDDLESGKNLSIYVINLGQHKEYPNEDTVIHGKM